MIFLLLYSHQNFMIAYVRISACDDRTQIFMITMIRYDFVNMAADSQITKPRNTKKNNFSGILK